MLLHILQVSQAELVLYIPLATNTTSKLIDVNINGILLLINYNNDNNN